MFNKHSVFFTLTISFIISILLIIIVFISIIQKEKALKFHNTKRKYMTISKILNQEYERFGFENNLKYILGNMGLIIIENQEKAIDIFQNKNLKLLIKKKTKHILMYVFTNYKNNYLHIQTPFDEYIIIDNDIHFKNNFLTTFAVFVILFFTMIFIFYTIYKKLLPLNELREKIHKIGDNNMKLVFLKDGAKDEVSLLAKKLVEKSNHLNQLTEARNVFIRNIMHELKTPITKGRFLLELSNDNQTKEKLLHVFHKMESLISEFASIEEIIAKRTKIDIKEFFFDDILENSLDLLMLDNDNVISKNNKQFVINVNFKLFSIVVKNLIDNGIKYSKEKKIHIETKYKSISFINDGDKLKHPLKNYFEPFYDSVNKKDGGFGLGLYIINSILIEHKFKLNYKYENNKNIFTISM